MTICLYIHLNCLLLVFTFLPQLVPSGADLPQFVPSGADLPQFVPSGADLPQFVPSGADPQTLWRGFYQRYVDELPKSEQSADNFALFAAMDEAESLLFARMSKVIPAPPNPAHPTFQMLYNADKEIAQQMLSDPTDGTIDQKSHKSGLWHKVPWTKLRSSRVQMSKQMDNIVKVYMKLKNSSGGWAELVQKMYADMVLAKNSGVGDSAELRENCRKALQLLGEEQRLGGVDLQKIEPFKDFWTLVKSSANSLLALFSGPLRNESVGQRRDEWKTENIFRLLKTFTGESAIFKQIVGKNGKTDGKKRRRKRCYTILVLFGMILAFVGVAVLLCHIFGKDTDIEAQ
uniref:Uncharacterized protein n=1 Tax=Globodera rostochiensis TaxID=31243 RepID=A0A914GNW4_GLORO